MTDGADFNACSISLPPCSMSSSVGPYTFTPIGARMPVESITSRASMGCSFGAEVSPGRWVTLTICCQMSLAFLISGRHWRK